jgi:hypothetical protein
MNVPPFSDAGAGLSAAQSGAAAVKGSEQSPCQSMRSHAISENTQKVIFAQGVKSTRRTLRIEITY